VGQNLLVKQGVGQLSDSLNKIAKENVKKRTYYKWYLIEMDKSLGLGIAGRNKYVREDVVKLVK
jgi:hypothetical protein